MAYNNNHPPNINQGYAGNPPQAYYGNAGQQVNLQMPPPPPGSGRTVERINQLESIV